MAQVTILLADNDLDFGEIRAEWLEANLPEIFDALERELQAGRSLDEIRRMLLRKFGNDLRDAFVVRVLQAAEYLCSEMITPAM